MTAKFNECDTDNSGLVSLDEAKAVLTKPPFTFPDEKVTAVIATVIIINSFCISNNIITPKWTRSQVTMCR